jgi:hypothetical protein
VGSVRPSRPGPAAGQTARGTSSRLRTHVSSHRFMIGSPHNNGGQDELPLALQGHSDGGWLRHHLPDHPLADLLGGSPPTGTSAMPIVGHRFQLYLRSMKAPWLLQGGHRDAGRFRGGILPMAQMPQLCVGLLLLPAQLLLECRRLPLIRLLGEDDQPALWHSPVVAVHFTVAVALVCCRRSWTSWIVSGTRVIQRTAKRAFSIAWE